MAHKATAWMRRITKGLRKTIDLARSTCSDERQRGNFPAWKLEARIFLDCAIVAAPRGRGSSSSSARDLSDFHRNEDKTRNSNFSGLSAKSRKGRYLSSSCCFLAGRRSPLLPVGRIEINLFPVQMANQPLRILSLSSPSSRFVASRLSNRS